MRTGISSPLNAARANPAALTATATGLAFGVALASEWGVEPDADTISTDNGHRVQAILDYATTNSAATGAGLTVIFQPGDHGFATTVNLPVGPHIKREGEGTNPAGATGVSGTRFRRKGSFTGPIIRGVGTTRGYDAGGAFTSIYAGSSSTAAPKTVRSSNWSASPTAESNTADSLPTLAPACAH